MNIWHDIDVQRITPEEFVAITEISSGSKNKYELDKETGLLRLDRVLHASMHFPANYGFIPRTYADDDDPLDVLILCSESIVPMTLVDCYPVGVMKMIDSGQIDEKIIAICKTDPYYNNFYDISDFPEHALNEIIHFYAFYKLLEHKETMVREFLGREEAIKTISQCIKNYKTRFSGQ